MRLHHDNFRKQVKYAQFILKLLCYIFVLVGVLNTHSIFAKSSFNADDKTLLTIKLYSEPIDDRDRVLAYLIKLPKEESYSYYVGSDLPQWKYVNKNVIQGKFHSVSLVTIRVHPRFSKRIDIKVSAHKKADLIIMDSENTRVVWQGKINYPNKNHISIDTMIDNKKYYDTQTKIDKDGGVVWFEITGNESFRP